PLNSRCSRKCETPAWAGVSLREPVRTQRPRATDRTEGTSSVTTRTPESSLVSLAPAKELAAALALAPAAAIAPAPLAVAPAAAVAAGADRGQLLRRLALDRGVAGEAQADPAALLVDLDHGDVDQLAGLEHVVDRVDPLARLHVGDVEQAVGALDQLDEGAEGGRLDDFGGVVAVA